MDSSRTGRARSNASCLVATRLYVSSIRQLAQLATGLQGGRWTQPRAAETLAAVRLVADLKLTEQTSALMKKLDATTTRLQYVGLAVGLLAVVVATGQLLVALGR